MTNPIRGTVSFSAAGKSFTLKLSTNALVVLEEEIGGGIDQVGAMMQDPERGKMKLLRTIFKALLSTHHPDIDDLAAGDLIDEVGQSEATALIGRAFAAGQAKGGGKAVTGNPRKAATR